MAMLRQQSDALPSDVPNEWDTTGKYSLFPMASLCECNPFAKPNNRRSLRHMMSHVRSQRSTEGRFREPTLFKID
jgi:hypothetical protein